MPFFALIFLAAILQLEADELILEQNKIEIPGYPQALNPSLIRWNGSLLLSFRDYEKERIPLNQLGLIWLKGDFSPIGKPQMINMESENGLDTRVQDIRLIAVGKQLYAIFTQRNSEGVHRMGTAQLKLDRNHFSVINMKKWSEFPEMRERRNEKNWVPFSYNDKLHFAYSLSPHKIFRPFTTLSKCLEVATTEGPLHWPWGQLRGGTPALKMDQEYLAFFHSTKFVQWRGQQIKQYYMGAYTFSAHPPFEITRMTPKPIVGKGFYEIEPKTLWGTRWVIYPCGFIFDDQYIWVAYGRQDKEIWIAKLDRKKLLKSLQPVWKQ